MINEKFQEKPALVFWELTQACDLACRHCRASARPQNDSGELDLEQGKRLIDEIAAWNGPMLILTGGDPLKQPHFWDWIAYAREKRVAVSVTPSPTPLVTPAAVRKMKELGVNRLGLSLDGAAAQTHDSFRGVEGSFARVLEIAEAARRCELSMQINTTVTSHNVMELEAMAGWVRWFGAAMWSLFFLVPVGRGKVLSLFTASEMEKLFSQIYQLHEDFNMAIKTTEAPHYRRYCAQRKNSGAVRGKRVGDGRGVVFVSHIGEIYPSGFLPLSAGNVKGDSLQEIYCQSDLFQSLRDPDQFKGKCGRCEYHFICGGSRARAWALTGDPLESDPCCAYQPKGASEAIAIRAS